MNAVSDILVIGGGVIGLAIAVELRLRGATVTVLSRDYQQAAARAAGGMLAPGAERLSAGPMRELCLKSRWLYPEWARKLEELTGCDIGYWPCGILSPQYERLHQIADTTNNAVWLEREAMGFYQPGLSQEVVGGWWYPEDAQVDNRSLAKALVQACHALNVDLREGVAVEAIAQRQGKVDQVLTSAGPLAAQQYVLATGAWSGQLLPVPVSPVKGQMLSLQMQTQPPPLPIGRILYGTDIYLVPRRDGRLLVGATVEEVGWKPHNTPAGIHDLMKRAIRLYPSLQHWPIEEIWWGFRPGTPDELPLLGTCECENLVLAIGHYRNGILLAPATALLIADLIWEQKADPLLAHFGQERFYTRPKQKPTRDSSNVASALTQAATSMIITSPSSAIAPLQPSLAQPLTKSEEAPSLHDGVSLTIAGRTFSSRLMTGTGKYSSSEIMQQSIAASSCEIVTVAVRRVQTRAPGHEGLAEALDWTKLWMLPNTAGCQTAEEAVRVARLGREMAKLLGQEDNNFVKLEVIADSKYLLPDPIGTLQAAEQLVKEGFAVLPYINADPQLAKRLEEAGCVTVMPLGSPIGSGQGIKNAANIAIIIEEATVPVVVDAGIGTPSEAAYAMELGADALLINSAIALAQNPVAMARAMGMATEAGRLAYLAGRIPVKVQASASSPLTGTVN